MSTVVYSNNTSASNATALVISPTGWGSVGDDALLRGGCQLLLARGMKVLILTGAGRAQWEQVLSDLNVRVITQNELLSVLFFSSTYRINHVYIIGADIMDGGYGAGAPVKRLLLARFLKYLGKKISIISYSFNKNPLADVLKGFQRLGSRARYALRDRQSLVRFEETTGLKGTLVADIGFLAQPAHTPQIDELIEWCDQVRSEGGVVVFVNLNVGPFHKSAATKGCTPAEIVNSMLQVLAELKLRHNLPLAVAVVPHDFREVEQPWSDVALAESLHKGLKPIFADRVRMVPTPFNSAEMCAMASAADLVITGRMHLAILSIAAGTPPVSFTYQDKFEGMYEHVFADRSDLMLSSETLLSSPGEIADSIKRTLDRRSKLEAEILENRLHIVSLAEKNFSI